MSDSTCMVCIHTNDKKYTIPKNQPFPAASNSLTGITHKTKYHDNALGRRIWDEKKIYWRMDSGLNFVPDSKFEKLIKNAFLEISMETPLVIRQKRRGDAHIIINTRTKKEDTYFNSDSTLAYGFGPASGIGGDITFNRDVLWLLRNTPLTVKEAYDSGYIENYDRAHPESTLRYYDPQHTMTHEGGHALGCNHIVEEKYRHSAIMFPFYNGQRILGDADKSLLHSFYGVADIGHRIKEIIRGRIDSYFG